MDTGEGGGEEIGMRIWVGVMGVAVLWTCHMMMGGGRGGSGMGYENLEQAPRVSINPNQGWYGNTYMH